MYSRVINKKTWKRERDRMTFSCPCVKDMKIGLKGGKEILSWDLTREQEFTWWREEVIVRNQKTILELILCYG